MEETSAAPADDRDTALARAALEALAEVIFVDADATKTLLALTEAVTRAIRRASPPA
jgi:hypothetical protein